MFFKGQRDASVHEKGTCGPAEFHLWNLHDENREPAPPSCTILIPTCMRGANTHALQQTHTQRHKHTPNKQINREIKKLKCF